MPLLRIFLQNHRWLPLDVSDAALSPFGVEMGQVCTTKRGDTHIMLGVQNQTLFYTLEGSNRVFFDRLVTNEKSLLKYYTITETVLTFNTLKAAIDLPMRLDPGELPAELMPSASHKRKSDEAGLDKATKEDWARRAIGVMVDVAQGSRPGLRQYSKEKQAFIRNYFAMFYHRQANSHWQGRAVVAKRIRETVEKICPEASEDDNAEACNNVTAGR